MFKQLKGGYFLPFRAVFMCLGRHSGTDYTNDCIIFLQSFVLAAKHYPWKYAEWPTEQFCLPFICQALPCKIQKSPGAKTPMGGIKSYGGN
jgi:hypothetical protein